MSSTLRLRLIEAMQDMPVIDGHAKWMAKAGAWSTSDALWYLN